MSNKGRKALQRQHSQMVARRGELDVQIRAAEENMAAMDEERALIAPAYGRMDGWISVDGRIPVEAGVDIIDIATSVHYQQQLLDEFDEIMGHVPQTQRAKLYARMADGNRRQGGSVNAQ